NASANTSNSAPVRHTVTALIRTQTKRVKKPRPQSLLPDIDGRSMIARRYRDIFITVVNDQGGMERITEIKEQLIKRYAAAAVIAEMMESALAQGKDIDVPQHALVTNSLVRLAGRIGIDRRSKVINTPALKDYLDHKSKNRTLIEHDEDA